MIRARVEGVDLSSAVGGGDASVNAAHGPAAQGAGPVLQHVQLSGELREDKDFMRVRKEVWDQPVQERHFPGSRDERFVRVL